MTLARTIVHRLALGAALALSPGLAAPAVAFDEALLDELLERHTREVADTAGVRVDYGHLARDPRWRELIASLAEGDAPQPADRSRHLAFWINAYNVLAIDVVLQRYPIDSIRDVGSLLRPVWDRPAGSAGGRGVTLGEIEHGILRPLGEPRIHAAIVCASTSCPSLRREAYRAARLEEQLEDSLRRFLSNPEKGSRLESQAGVLRLSRIFDWFAKDFAPFGGVRAYLAPRLPEESARALRERGERLSLRYFDYDWSLNDLRP